MQLVHKMISYAELEYLYHNYIIFDFPKEEIKSLSLMKKMMDNKQYKAILYYQNNNLVGYSIVCIDKEQKFVLLDYLAVVKEYRGQHIGGEILKKLKEILNNYQALLLEVEDPYSGDVSDQLSKLHRIGFYLRNGVINSYIFARAEGVPYQILYLPLKKKEITDREVINKMKEFYQQFFSYDIENINKSFLTNYHR